jgi:hypothetical protein
VGLRKPFAERRADLGHDVKTGQDSLDLVRPGGSTEVAGQGDDDRHAGSGGYVERVEQGRRGELRGRIVTDVSGDACLGQPRHRRLGDHEERGSAHRVSARTVMKSRAT